LDERVCPPTPPKSDAYREFSMRFSRLITGLLSLGLIGLPALVLSAGSASAAGVTTRSTVGICAVAPNGTCYTANSAHTSAVQVYNRTLHIEGELQRTDTGAGLAAKPVQLLRKAAGTSTWVAVSQVNTASDGTYLFSLAATTNAAYRVYHPATSESVASYSSAVVAKVARNLGAQKKRIDAAKWRFFGKVSPKYAKKPVFLQRKVGPGAWRTIEKQRTTKRSRWGFVVSAKSTPGVVRYRTFVKGSTKYIKSYSVVFAIRTTRA
jgi:hypothetical protein